MTIAFYVHPEADECGMAAQGASWLLLTADLPRLQWSDRQLFTYSIERGSLVFVDQPTVKNARIFTCSLTFLVTGCLVHHFFFLLTCSFRNKAHTDNGLAKALVVLM